MPVSETTPSLSRAGRADSVDKTADAFAKTSIKSSEVRLIKYLTVTHAHVLGISSGCESTHNYALFAY